MLTNSSSSYGTIAKLFHWVMGLMIIGLIIAGFYMASLPNSPQKFQIYALHKATGVVILCLFALRLLWKNINKEVLMPSDLPRLIAFFAKLGHFTLYCFMFLMPFSGIMMSLYGGHNISLYGLYTIQSFKKAPQVASFFHDIHMTSAFILSAVIILHVLAAFYHHFIRRDNIVRRMI